MNRRLEIKKYLEIGRISMKTQMAYRFDVYLSAVMPFVRVFLAYALWSVLFTGKETIGGYTMNMMITYYILVAFLARLDQSNNMVWNFANEIREGQFTKYLVKPVSPLGHFMAASFAKTLYILGVSVATVFVLALIFRKLFVAPSSMENLALALFIAFLGLIFMSLLNYLTSIMAFKVTEIAGIHLLKYNIVEFLSGMLIPLMLLPSGVQQVMRFFPFYYIQYLPASLYLGKNTDEVLTGIAVLTLWIIALYFVSEYTYHRLRRKYEGVGA